MTEQQKRDAAKEERPREVRIVAHSMLFYWWPVWAVGLLLAGLTWLSGYCLALRQPVHGSRKDFDGNREALVLPASSHLPQGSLTTGKARSPPSAWPAAPATASSLSLCCSSSSS